MFLPLRQSKPLPFRNGNTCLNLQPSKTGKTQYLRQIVLRQLVQEGLDKLKNNVINATWVY